MISSDAIPTVSIGLPVFNGENFLEEAIRSVLLQTFADFELIICDNASTDRSGDIAKDYASRDRRVRYYRNARNLGAAPNFNLAFRHSRGQLFKWLAHDDRLSSRYLESTVAALQSHPDAALCNSFVRYIDERARPVASYDSGLDLANSSDPVARFEAMVLGSYSCVDFYGLFRRRALCDSVLYGSYHGAQRALLVQMALRGRLVQLSDELLELREHDGRYSRRHTTAVERLEWHNSALAQRIDFPTWRLYAEYTRMVRLAWLSQEQRAQCASILLRWWGHNWNAVRAAKDLVTAAAPNTVSAAEPTGNWAYSDALNQLLGRYRR